MEGPVEISSSACSLMDNVSFSEVSTLLENIRNAKCSPLKLDVWKKYFLKFQESHKNEVCKFIFLLFSVPEDVLA